MSDGAAKIEQRCKALDAQGCRCLLRALHRGPHDHSYTPWLEVLAARQRRERESQPTQEAK